MNPAAPGGLHPEIPASRLLKADLTDPAIQRRIKKQPATEPNLVLVVGGPPGKNVSLIGTTGRRAATTKRCRFDECATARTFIAFRDVVKALKTQFFVMGNVTGLFAANEGRARQEILDDFSDLYATAYVQVDAFDHGVPQHRQRILVVGVLKGQPPELAETALAFLIDRLRTPLARAPWNATFGEAVSDLPRVAAAGGAEFARHPQSPSSTRPPTWSLTPYQHAMKNGSHLVFNHVARPNNERDVELYRLLKPGEVGADVHRKYNRPDLMIYRNDIFLDKYRRQVWDGPGTTIVAHLAKDGHMFIHPKQARSISVREAARLQSFPDDFIFFGPRTEQFRQVGNAVPPLLGARIRTAVLETLDRFFP